MYYILNFVNSYGKEVSMKFDDFTYFGCSDFITCLRFSNSADYNKIAHYIFPVDKVNYIERVIVKDDQVIREKVKRF